jgi:hypothetical protein
VRGFSAGPTPSLIGRAALSRAIEATGLGADQDVGAVVAVEVGRLGLAGQSR